MFTNTRGQLATPHTMKTSWETQISLYPRLMQRYRTNHSVLVEIQGGEDQRLWTLRLLAQTSQAEIYCNDSF